MKVQVFQFSGSSDIPCPRLEIDHVHVWHARTQPAFIEPSTMLPWLSPEEQARAQRFRFPKNRDEFLLSHGMLRILLGSYLGISPSDVEFRFGANGKPELNHHSPSATGITFNLSHTDGLALCAFTRGVRIGVDVEKIRKDFETAEIAERFFSPAERDALRRLPAPQQHQSFFRCWTRKEAYIKALGEGLSHPLHQFDVSIDAEQASLIATRPDPSEASRWFLHPIPLPDGYEAALALEIARDDSTPRHAPTLRSQTIST